MNREELDAKADELAVRAQDGDPHAFDDLCRTLRDDVWRYCRALTDDREQAFDATQDAFLRLVNALPGWRGDAPIRVFLLVLARRAVADLIRKEQRRRRLADLSASDEPVAETRTGTIEVSELINGLDPDQQQAFVLTQVLGLRYEEAADVAEVPIGTIRSRVARARTHLAEQIRRAEGH